MNWMTSGAWIFFGILAMGMLRQYRTALEQSLPTNDSQNTKWLYRIVQSAILFTVSMGCLLSISSETSVEWNLPIVLSALCGLWWVAMSGYIFSQRSPLEFKLIPIILASTMSGYAGLMAWELAPPPLYALSWYRSLSMELQSVLAIVGGICTAILVHTLIIPIMEKVTSKTDSILDDTLLDIIRWPVSISIAMIGVGHAVTNSMLSEFWVQAFHGSSLSVLIALWTHVALQGCNIILAYLLKNEEKWIIVNERTLPIFHLLFRIVILTASIYLLLLAWGINAMLWITSAGVIGIAVAYASQDTLASLFAGVAILSDAPYKLQDYLIIDDSTRGRVTQIGFRSTRLLTTENIEIIIPNSIMANAQIINMSGGTNPAARIEISAGVAYGSDVEQVRALLLEVGQQLEHVILDQSQFQPVVHFTSMGASSLDFILRVWITNPEKILIIQDQANTKIYNTFKVHGIEIPYTKQDVYLYTMPSKI